MRPYEPAAAAQPSCSNTKLSASTRPNQSFLFNLNFLMSTIYLAEEEFVASQIFSKALEHQGK